MTWPCPEVRLVLVCLLGATCLLAGGAARGAGPAITGLALQPAQVGRYQRLEITFRLSRSYANPFDPAQVDVTARVQAPSGRVSVVPAFPYQEYRSRLEEGREVLQAVGQPVWKVRFAPVELGRHSLALLARDGQGRSRSSQVSFQVVPAAGDGFLRRSSQAPRRFQFDSGRPYFALGENMCWPSGATPLADYERWFTHLAAAGGNYARLWLAGTWIATAPIAWEDPAQISADRFNLASSWRLDRVVEMAEHQGLYLMLCLDSFNSLRESDPYPQFERYPLNRKYGGPLASPRGFFTDRRARELFQRRLRYYVARWGYSTHVLAWEFWNEVDLVEGYDREQVRAWHQEMARHLRALDPWRHLITTSFARSEGEEAVDSLAEMDFVQTHSYGARDVAGVLVGWSQHKAARYPDKPHFIGEFGTDVLGKEDAADVGGVHLHNGLWASALSGDAGTAMTWWWDSYVEPRQLYHHFGALSRFLAGVDWAHCRPAAVSLAFPAGTSWQPADLLLQPKAASWDPHPSNQPRQYRVGRDGRVSDQELLSQVLHGVTNHPREHNPPTFLVDYPAPGAFEVLVTGVSGWGGANLRMMLDGETRLSADFPDTAPADHETMQQFNRAYRIAVPAGPHRITVENTGADWAFVAYRFVGYLTSPQLRVVALADQHSALLWLQNPAHTWWNVAQGQEIKPLPPVRVTLDGLADGTYQVAWWDTYQGQPTGRQEAAARRGRLSFTTPRLTTDIACKLTRHPQ